MKGYRRIAAVIVGIVFLSAGILKLMDPVGAGLVVEEYFRFLHLGFLVALSKGTAFALALLESVVGIALVTGVKRVATAIVSAAMLFFFTGLTLVLWISNPPMDCGCFGEAIHLTHAQSLIKNLILCALWVVAFVPVGRYGGSAKMKYASFLVGTVSVIVFGIFELFHLPMVDFTPMAPGAELFNASEETLYDGSPILSFYDADYEYRDSLAFGENVMVVSVYDAGSMDAKGWEKVESFLESAGNAGYHTLLLSTDEPVEGRFFADRRTLLTLNRSNGGVTLISDGQVIRKWPYSSLPDEEMMQKIITSDSTEVMIESSTRSKTGLQAFLLYVFAVILLI